MRLKELRQERGLTQAEVARAICTSQRNIGRWENEENEPASNYVAALAKFFQVSSDYLLGLVDEFGTPVITSEEKVAGASATKKISITPIEDEMLYVFREVGKTRGEPAHRAIIEIVEKML